MAIFRQTWVSRLPLDNNGCWSKFFTDRMAFLSPKQQHQNKNEKMDQLNQNQEYVFSINYLHSLQSI